ncbi:MAG: 50S ribosomal protein L24 [Candidatus Nezhaarchaeales archaeon]
MTASSKPSKQRLALIKAPKHKRRKLLSASLSKELKKQYGFRSLPVRKGDTVMVMRGDYTGHVGKVLKSIPETGRIHIEGVTMKKADGTEVFVPIAASKVVITKLDLSDELRKKAVERKAGGVHG